MRFVNHRKRPETSQLNRSFIFLSDIFSVGFRRRSFVVRRLSGRSHDKSYTLFRVTQKASEGLKLFAENGRSDLLDAQSQGEGGVYDEFNAPPITSGEGRAEAEFFVDSNHTRVSAD